MKTTVFKKKIVKPGVYKTGKDKENLTPVTAGRLKNTANTGNKMIEAGIKIPAPYAHKDGDGVIPAPMLVQDDQDVDAKVLKPASWNSSINAGFWNKFEIDKEDNGLVGYVEVPGDENDPESPAGKVGKPIKETSIFLVDEYEDGLGRKWEDAPWHIALVTNAVEPGQEDFEIVKNQAHEQELAIAMSLSMSDEVNSDTLSKEQSKSEKDPDNQGGQVSNGDTPDTGIPAIISCLQEKLGIILPSDTDEGNFMDRLLVALTNFQNPNKEEGDLTTKPDGAQVQSSPVDMADQTPTTESELQASLKLMNFHDTFQNFHNDVDESMFEEMFA